MNYGVHYTLAYPLPSKLLHDLDEGNQPHLYNHLAWGGKQIVLYRGRREYHVATSNWRPVGVVVPNPLSIS